MRKVRLILLILMASICPLLLATSHFWYFEIGHLGSAHYVDALLEDGNISLVVDNLKGPPHWDADYGYAGSDGPDLFEKYCFAGFGAKPYVQVPDEFYGLIVGFVRVPLWFLSCVGFLFGWWMWRRGRRKKAKGFPVEVQAK